MKLIKLLNNIEKYVIFAVAFLFPLFFTTIFQNAFELPKLFILYIGALIILLIKAVKIITKNELEINIGKYDILMTLLLIVSMISTFVNRVNLFDAFFVPGSTSFIVIGIFVYFVILQLNKRDKEMLLDLILISSVVVAILQIGSQFGIYALIPNIDQFFKSKLFSPLGNLPTALVFSISSLAILTYKTVKEESATSKILYILVSTILFISITFLTITMFGKNQDRISILPLKYGWSIAADSVKLNPLLGTGPTNFINAFNALRPINYNSETIWDTVFAISSSTLLTITTELGILGIIVFISILFYFVKNKDLKNPLFYGISTIIAGIILLPANSIIFVFMFIYLAIYTDTISKKLANFSSKAPQLFIATPLVIISVLVMYLVFQIFRSEYFFNLSISQIRQNKVQESYQNIYKAISINPYSDRYHLFAANINLAIANNLSKKENINDEEKEYISKLIQQTIAEGKASVALNQNRSTNWENLADTYRTIIAFAKGADIFAIESFNQAIALNPINPNLRIKLGSLYFSLKKNEEAVEALKLAIVAKPDFPNSHYNLALVYKEQKNLDKAKEEINTTLKLLGKESKDYDTALKELQSIEELTKPEATPEPALEPKLDITE